MSLVVLCSASGSPGVTTLTLTTARLAVPRTNGVVVVEADVAGGSMAAYTGCRFSPGLVSLAAQTWGDLDGDALAGHGQELAPGLVVLPGPATGREAWWALRSLGARLAEGLARVAAERLVLVDVGRLGEESPAAAVAAMADLLVVVVGQSRSLTAHAASAAVSRAAGLVGWASEVGIATGVVVVGAGPWPVAEISAEFAAYGAPVLGVVPHDTKAGAVTAGQRVRRSGLTRAAEGLAGVMLEVSAGNRRLAGPSVGVPQSIIVRPTTGEG